MFETRFIGLSLLIFSLASCGDETSTNRNTGRPSVKAEVPISFELTNTGQINYGDTLHLSVASIIEGKEVDAVEIFLTDEKRRVATGVSTINLPTSAVGGGEVRITAIATLSDGTTATKVRSVRILASKAPEAWQLKVLKKYPHDSKSFTQGLLVHEGLLYEGTGNYGESRLRKLDLATGKVLLEKPIEETYFGEGITIFGGKLYQLTYKSTKAFRYNLGDFSREAEFTFAPLTGEGWGLTHNDTSLIASDGSAYLYFINPVDFSVKSRIRVFDDKGEVVNINELEYYQGKIYANIYGSALVVAIDPGSGMITDSYSARGIVDKAEATSGMDVLNGIAINPLNGNFLLTGKYWGRIYEVRAELVAGD